MIQPVAAKRPHDVGWPVCRFVNKHMRAVRINTDSLPFKLIKTSIGCLGQVNGRWKRRLAG